MTSKTTKWILKYFYFSINSLSVIFFLTCDFKKMTVRKSNVKSVILAFWSIFFFYVSIKEWFNIPESELAQKGSVSLNARIIEFTASVCTMTLVTIVQFRNSRKNREFVELMMKVYENMKINYELFEDSIGYQITIVGIVSDFGLYFICLNRLRYGINRGESYLALDISENLIWKSLISCFPFELVTRYCIALTFFIDFTRKVIRKLNSSLEESIERIKSSKDSDDCCAVIQQTDQWITMIQKIIKSYETNFAFLILVFQCIAFISGVSQVNEILFNYLSNIFGFLTIVFLQMFFLFKLVSSGQTIEILSLMEIFFSCFAFIQICMVR